LVCVGVLGNLDCDDTGNKAAEKLIVHLDVSPMSRRPGLSRSQLSIDADRSSRDIKAVLNAVAGPSLKLQ
jgi:hypothetical protein